MNEPVTIDLLAEEKRALQRIALSPDGHFLHRYLRRVLEGVVDISESGALQSHNGRRSLARDLMREMAQGIEESTRVGPGSPNEPILSRPGQPVAITRRQSVREWIAASDPELADTRSGTGSARSGND